MEAALFQKHLNKHPTHLDHLTENRDTPEAVVIQDYKKTIIQEYRGDWERFFIDWRLKQEKQHLEVVSLIKQKAQQALKDAEEARQKYDTIYEQYVEVQKKLQFIQEEAELQKKLREKKESLKLKKKNAKRMEWRQTVSSHDFQVILNLVKGKKFIRQRRRLAFVLLYLTGLRVSNLLLLKVQHIKELIEQGKTNIPLIKNGASRHDIALHQKGLTLLRQYINDYQVLAEDKTNDMPFFSAIDKKDQTLARENFDKELNCILKKASVLLEKHIRTHSFRATVITELLKSTPIEDVAEYMGHRSISSTLEYKRSRLTITQIKKISAKRLLKKITKK